MTLSFLGQASMNYKLVILRVIGLFLCVSPLM